MQLFRLNQRWGTPRSPAESESHSVMSDSLRPHGLQPARLLCLWDSPGKNTGVGFHFLLQGIFLTQGLNPDLLHCRWILYHLSHQRRPTICPLLHPSLLQPWEPSKILLFHRTQFADPKDPQISKKRQIFFINAALTPYHVNGARLTEIHSCNFMCQPSL